MNTSDLIEIQELLQDLRDDLRVPAEYFDEISRSWHLIEHEFTIRQSRDITRSCPTAAPAAATKKTP